MSSTPTDSNTTITYKWLVDKFSTRDELQSPKFLLNFDSTSVHLLLNAKDSHGLHTSVCLQIYSTSNGNLGLRTRISFLKENGEKFNTLDGEAHIKNSNYMSTCKNCIYRNYLMSPANGLLIDDKITIYCEIDKIDPQNVRVVQNQVPNNLSEDFESLFQSGKSSDVTLLVGGGDFGEAKEFESHKLILSTRSKVFAAMFDHSDTKEAQEGRVHIADIGADVFGHFLRYIYTDKIEPLDEFGLDLLAVADKYQVESLKQICAEYLQSNLTNSTVINALLVADLHLATELKSKCIDYITDNVSKVKEETEGWKVLGTKPELLMQLLLHLAEKTNR